MMTLIHNSFNDYRADVKTLLVFFFLFLVLHSKSQDTITYHSYDLGFSYSPDLSYRILRADETTKWMKGIYDTLEVSKFGYTTGININFQLKKKFELNTGILFSDKGERTKKYAIQPVNNYVHHFYYLDIPIKFSYHIRNKKYYYSKLKKTHFFLSAGISTSIYLKNKTVTASGEVNTEKSINEKIELSRCNLSILAGLGLITPLSNKWYLRFEPIYRRSITSASNDPIKKYFFSLGINLGIFSKF